MVFLHLEELIKTMEVRMASLQAEIQIWDLLDVMHYPMTLNLHTV